MPEAHLRRGALTLAVTLAALVPAVACQPGSGIAGGETAPPATESEQTLYALGAALARGLDDFRLTPAESDQVAAGLRAALRGETLAADPKDFQQQIRALQMERMAALVEEEKLAAADFVALAAQAEGAVQTPSGLVFVEVEEGTGDSPTADSVVSVHYHGTLRDGTVFDSSVQRGQPARFPVNGVIPCWQEALQRMRPGGKARIVCPSTIAYGDRGAPPAIPGGAALQFEVELLEIAPPE